METPKIIILNSFCSGMFGRYYDNTIELCIMNETPGGKVITLGSLDLESEIKRVIFQDGEFIVVLVEGKLEVFTYSQTGKFQDGIVASKQIARHEFEDLNENFSREKLSSYFDCLKKLCETT